MYQKIFIALCGILMASSAFAASQSHNLMKRHFTIESSANATKSDNYTDLSGAWRTDSCGSDKQVYTMDIIQHGPNKVEIDDTPFGITPLLQSSSFNSPLEAFQEVSTAKWNSDGSLTVRYVVISKSSESSNDLLYTGIYKETYSLINPSQIKVDRQGISLQDVSVAANPQPSTCIFNKIK